MIVLAGSKYEIHAAGESKDQETCTVVTTLYFHPANPHTQKNPRRHRGPITTNRIVANNFSALWDPSADVDPCFKKPAMRQQFIFLLFRHEYRQKNITLILSVIGFRFCEAFLFKIFCAASLCILPFML